MGANKLECTNCILLSANICLILACVLSLLALVTPKWVRSEVDLEVGIMKYKLTVEMGLFEESCDVQKMEMADEEKPKDLFSSLLGSVVDIFVPIDDLCEKQIQERGEYVATTIVLLIIALVLGCLAAAISLACHFWPRWWLVGLVPLLTVVIVALQIAALVQFIAGASDEKDKFAESGVIKNVRGEMRYSMMFQFVSVGVFMMSAFIGFVAVRSVKSKPNGNAVRDYPNARCSVAASSIDFGRS